MSQDEAPEYVANGTSAQVPRPRATGFRGYTIVPQYAAGEGKKNPKPEGSAGEYRVTAMLGVPGRDTTRTAISQADFGVRGDSLIQVPNGWRGVKVVVEIASDGRLESYEIVAGVNDEQHLRDLKFTVHADSFNHASRTAHDVIMPLLSRWAFLHDVPITTSGTLIVEVRTQSLRMEAMVAGTVVDFADQSLPQTKAEHRLLLSAYREGVSSTEPLWQALSFLRVGEGVRALRKKRGRANPNTSAATRDAAPTERIDLARIHDADARRALLEYEGQRINKVFDKLHDKLRNAIAHLDPEKPFGQDQHSDISRIISVLPALRWVARRLLEDELRN